MYLSHRPSPCPLAHSLCQAISSESSQLLAFLLLLFAPSAFFTLFDFFFYLSHSTSPFSIFILFDTFVIESWHY